MKNALKDRLMYVVKNNRGNRKVIKSIAKEFTSKGFSKSIATKVFADSSRLVELDPNNELILFTKALYQATKDYRIKPDILFTKEELEKFEEQCRTKNIEYMPANKESLKERELRKLEYLNDAYGNRNSKQHLYYLYLAHIKEEEDRIDSDLYDFTKWDIIELMQGIIGSIQLQQRVLSFINSYLDYCVKQGYTTLNVLETIDKDNPNEELIKTNHELVASTYVTIDELVKELEWLVEDEENDIHAIDMMIALLMRSGVSAREIIDLKNSDFDFEKKCVFVKVGEKTKRVNLSDKALYWVKEARDSDSKVGKSRHTLNTIDDHIIKLSGDTYDTKKALMSIRKRMTKFAEVGFRSLNESILINCAKIDLLETILKINGELTTDDFRKVQVLFGNSENTYYKLKTDWQLLKGDDGIEYQRKNVGKKFER